MRKRTPTESFLLGRLQRLHAAQGMSCGELARRSGVDVDRTEDILAGRRIATPLELRRLLKALVAAGRDGAVERPAWQAGPRTGRDELTARRDCALRERDELQAEVEQLHEALHAERSSRTNALADLRDAHMREVVAMRRHFHEEIMETRDAAQAREDKLIAALRMAHAELTCRARSASSAAAPPPHGPSNPSSGRASEERTTSWIETAAGVAIGLGGLALGTWLATSKSKIG